MERLVYWSLRQYFVMVDGSLQDDLTKLEDNLSAEVDWELMDSWTARNKSDRGFSIHCLAV